MVTFELFYRLFPTQIVFRLFLVQGSSIFFKTVDFVVRRMENENNFSTSVHSIASSTQKKRSTNFTPTEKNVLLELIEKKYKNILENKKTDRVSVGERAEAWSKIEQEFNSRCPSGFFRDSETLKRMYDNRKRDIRRIMAQERQMRLKTGGGPEIKTELDIADQILLRIMNEKTVHGLMNPVDSDSVSTKLSSSNVVQENELVLMDINENTSINSLVDDEKEITVVAQAYKEKEVSTQPVTQVINLQEENDYPTWKKANDLKRKMDPTLQCDERVPKKVIHRTIRNNHPISSRQSVKILTSTDIAKKYNKLLDSRQILVEKQIEQANQELVFQRTKHKLELELLNLELAKKKRQ